MLEAIDLGRVNFQPIPANVEAFFLGTVVTGTRVEKFTHPKLEDPLVMFRAYHSNTRERDTLIIAARSYADIHEIARSTKEAPYTAFYFGPQFRTLLNPTAAITHDFLSAKIRLIPLMAGAMAAHLTGKAGRRALPIISESSAKLLKTAIKREMSVKLGDPVKSGDRNKVRFNIGTAMEAVIWTTIMEASSVQSLPFYEDLFFPGRKEAQWHALADEIAGWQPTDYNPFSPRKVPNGGGLDPELEEFGRIFGIVLRTNGNNDQKGNLLTDGALQNRALEILGGSFLRDPRYRRPGRR